MSVPQSVVVLTTALVSSPLVLLLHRGYIDVEGAAQRLGIAAVVCWVALRIVAALAFPATERRPAAAPAAPTTAPTSTPTSADADTAVLPVTGAHDASGAAA